VYDDHDHDKDMEYIEHIEHDHEHEHVQKPSYDYDEYSYQIQPGYESKWETNERADEPPDEPPVEPLEDYALPLAPFRQRENYDYALILAKELCTLTRDTSGLTVTSIHEVGDDSTATRLHTSTHFHTHPHTTFNHTPIPTTTRLYQSTPLSHTIHTRSDRPILRSFYELLYLRKSPSPWSVPNASRSSAKRSAESSTRLPHRSPAPRRLMVIINRSQVRRR
jgi:hypothetical protein